MREHFFVNVIILLQIGAIFNYTFLNKNIPLAIYWVACCTINYVVTYSIGR
jgi:hypothetical protein